MACNWLQWSLVGLGAVTAVKLGLSALSYGWSFLRGYVLPSLGIRKDLKRLGEWAVVTGSTDGIGKAYAEELARQGLNIVLISRSEEKLRATAEAIESSHGVQTKVVQADFSESGQQLYDRIFNQVKNLNVGILINNVGVAYENPEYFCEITTDMLWQLVNVNVAAVTLLTHAILPSMLGRKRGAVVNIASFAGCYPIGLMSVYSATKSYMHTFTQALQQEYSGTGVTIQSVVPLFVVTKMSWIKQPRCFVPTPTDFVHRSIGTIGYQPVSRGCVSHELQGLAISCLPSWLQKTATFNVVKFVMKKFKAEKQKSQ